MCKEAAVLQKENAKLRTMVTLRDEEITFLREQVQYMKDKLFGAKTEKLDKLMAQLQRPLFEMDELEQLEGDDDEPDGEEEVVTTRKKKNKRGKALPAWLPRKDRMHDLSDEEKACPCGCQMKRIGEEVTEELEYTPAKLFVIRHIRPKYACRACEGVESDEGAVKTAPAPARMIPRSMAAPGLLAFVMAAKFVDGLPFYRVENQLKRIGLHIPRGTMCRWAMRIAERLRLMWEIMHGQLLKSGYVQVDETTIQVMQEDGRDNRTKSYMWAMRGVYAGEVIILYKYAPTRSSSVAMELLTGFKGVVQTDGYEGYRFLDSWPDVIHAGCLNHARRKFAEVVKALGKAKSGKTGHAGSVLAKIRKLYRIETKAANQELELEAVKALRQSEAAPVMAELHEMLCDLDGKTPPRGLLGKAVAYTLSRWSQLQVYLEYPEAKPDTNEIENVIRPFVVGRKAWLFSGHPDGAEASGIMYSMVETAKANGWEPQAWLEHVCRKLPEATCDDEICALLPTVPPPLPENQH